MNAGEAPAAPLRVPQGLSDADLGGRHYRVMGARSRDGRYTVVAMESNAMRRATLLPILSIVAGSELVTLCISMTALWWAARRSFRPVQLLALEVAARGAGDLTPVGSYASYTELAPLINAFNALLDREAVRLDTERGFLADAAHELRTPLAVLSAQAHHLTSSSDKATQAAASEQLQLGVQRLSHVLRQLLTTARLDASPFITQVELIDAAELLRQRAAALIPVALKKEVRVAVEAPDQLMVHMNAFGLSSIVDNLVDNAIRYTPPEGDVLVTLRASDGTLELIVEDSGAGIPAELQEKVFERFFRVRGTLAEGSGLGLSIVKQIVLAHDGRISLHEGLGRRGLGVRVAFAI
jgi:signal transduction histidine kinase